MEVLRSTFAFYAGCRIRDAMTSGQAMLDALVVGEDDAEKLADEKQKRQEQPPNRKRSRRDPSRIARLTGVMPSPRYCPRKRNAGAPFHSATARPQPSASTSKNIPMTKTADHSKH